MFLPVLLTGSHGFHIHAIGDISGGCLTTGAHFNPKNVSTYLNNILPTKESKLQIFVICIYYI